jgi:hypothetical protein
MNEVAIEHEHGDARRPMELARVERVDGLAVEHYRCGCGHTVIVLGQAHGERPGASWPVQWLATGDPGQEH